MLYCRPLTCTGADPEFQVRGGALKQNCAERREARNFFVYFVWKITILHPKKIIFFPILGGSRAGVPPPGFAPTTTKQRHMFEQSSTVENITQSQTDFLKWFLFNFYVTTTSCPCQFVGQKGLWSEGNDGKCNYRVRARKRPETLK
jgi:hypothetical protein